MVLHREAVVLFSNTLSKVSYLLKAIINLVRNFKINCPLFYDNNWAKKHYSYLCIFPLKFYSLYFVFYDFKHTFYPRFTIRNIIHTIAYIYAKYDERLLFVLSMPLYLDRPIDKVARVISFWNGDSFRDLIFLPAKLAVPNIYFFLF